MEDVNISKYRASVVRDGSKPASPGFVVSEGQDPVNPPGTNNFVPYTGATANVELGEYGLESGFVTLDTTPTNTPTDQGTIYWDDARSTAALIMNGTLQHIGQDTFFYVKNSSGSNIAKGTCVRFAGTDGASGHILITPFLANGSVPSSYFMGVTSEAIANGAFGQVMHFGELEGINTSGFTAGALLYASTTVAGGFQTTAPVAPNNIVLVAAAINSKNNGAIIVRPQIGSNINNDEGVKITSIANLDLLQYQSGTGLWENKTLAQVIGSAYVPSTRTITINGTTQDLSANRTFNVGTVTSVTATSPMTSTGGTTPNLEMPAANTGVSGYLTFPDWNTFNGKVGISANGQTNYIAKFSGINTITNSQIFDNGTNVGIGTSSPSTQLQIVGSSFSIVRISGASNNVVGVDFGTVASPDIARIRYSNSTNSFTIRANGSDYLFLNSSGNLGLGVTPSAWVGATGLQVQYATVEGRSSIPSFAEYGANTFSESGVRKYITSDFASRYTQFQSNHYWFTAPSGTAGNAISFTQAMTLTSGGNLLLGTTTDNGARLQVSGTASVGTLNVNTSTSGERINVNGAIGFQNSSSVQKFHLSYFNGGLNFTETGVADYRLFIKDGGNVGIGTSSPAAELQVAKGSDVVIAMSNSSSITSGARGSLAWYNSSVSTVSLIRATAVTDNVGTQLEFHIRPAAGSLTQAMTLTSGGNLLVGTTSDNGARLQVSGNVTASGYFSSDAYRDSRLQKLLGYEGGNQIRMGSGDVSDFLTFFAGATERMRITSGGSIEFVGTSSGLAGAYFTNDNTSLKFHSTFGGNTTKDLILQSGGSAGAPTLILKAGGNVLIGTTSDAGSRLHVVGSSLTNTFRVTDAANYTICMGYEGTGNIGLISTLGTTASLALGTNSTARLTINGSTGAANFSSSVTANSSFISTTAFGGTFRASDGTNEVRFGSYFNTIGAGNSYDGVIYTTSASGALYFLTGGSTTSRMTITSSGDVGIGTTTTASALSGSARVLAIVDNATANLGSVRVYGGGTATSLELYGGASAVGLFGSTNHPMTFSTNSTERMRITSGGSVGIGTSSPGQMLTVNGAIESLKDSYNEGGHLILRAATGGTKRWNIDNYIGDELRFFTEDDSTGTSGSVKMLITSGGNVLIGTTTNGSSKLKINGLPTSSAGLASGDVWNDSGTLKIA